MKSRSLALFILLLLGSLAHAQMPMRPPPFIGGVPGMNQWQAIENQRHQARTLLYLEALEELRRNPKAADLQDCAAQTAGPCIPAAASESRPENAASAQSEQPRRKLALLVGNNNYPYPIPPLETPLNDVDKLGELLAAQFSYETRIIKDARKGQMAAALQELAAEALPGDSVLIMYAGHGYQMDDTGMGFWLPVDASVKTAANWISNSDISRFLQAIRARQIMLVSDSCFSGTLTGEQQVRQSAQLEKEEILRRRTVLVLSSGGEEPVTDEGREGHSIFAWSLLRTLETLDSGQRGFEVYQKVHNQVSRIFPQQPQYGAVVSAGHMAGGDFLLER